MSLLICFVRLLGLWTLLGVSDCEGLVRFWSSGVSRSGLLLGLFIVTVWSALWVLERHGLTAFFYTVTVWCALGFFHCHSLVRCWFFHCHGLVRSWDSGMSLCPSFEVLEGHGLVRSWGFLV